VIINQVCVGKNSAKIVIAYQHFDTPGQFLRIPEIVLIAQSDKFAATEHNRLFKVLGDS
jgi:hypothetical protein